MQVPSPITATDRLVDLNTYTCARLGAKPDHADLAAPLQTAKDRLILAQNNLNAAHEAMISALALRDAADQGADTELRRLFHRIKEVTGQTRGSEPERRHFPNGLSMLVRSPIRKQIGEMRVLVGGLTMDEDERIAAFEDLIDQAADDLEDKQDSYDTAVQGAEVAYGLVLAARTDWIRCYERTYGELVARDSKKKAEGFFKKVSKSKKSGAPSRS